MPQPIPSATRVVSALALAVSQAMAQPAPNTTVAGTNSFQMATLDPVVVTASRFEEPLSDVPAFVQMITKEEIMESGSFSIGEVVSRIANVNVRSPQGGQLGVQSDIDIRGFGASARDNTLILVDGLRISPIDSGSIRWESIALSAVERIEIIHGGGSVQYGDKAVGGVVNIVTRDALRPGASAALTTGSFGTVLSSVSWVGEYGSTTSRVDVTGDRTDGWRENSAAWQTSAKGVLSQRLGGFDRIFLEGTYSAQNFHTPGGVVGEVNTGDRRAAKFNNVNEQTASHGTRGVIGIERALGGDWQFLAELAYSESSSTQDRPYYANDGNATTAGKLVYDKRALDFTPRIKRIWGPQIRSVMGVDYQRAKAFYSPDTGDRQNATIDNKAIYVSHIHQIAKDIDVSAGVRRQIQKASAYDKYGATITTADKEQDASAADLAISYRFGEFRSNKVYARANRSYRFANTDEYWGCNYDAFWNCVRTYKGILRPQLAQSYDVGGSWSLTERSVASASLFHVITTDEIRYKYAEDANINAPKIRRIGGEIAVQHALSKALSVRVMSVFQQTEYLAGVYEGREVPLVPQWIASAGVRYVVAPAMIGNLSARYTARQRYMDDDDNTKNRMPSYVLVDLGVSHTSKDWELGVQVKNLTNEKYATYGGYGFITTSTGSRNSYFYYPGDPRTVWLSAKYTFH